MRKISATRQSWLILLGVFLLMWAEECFPVFIWDGGPVHGGYRNSESGCI